MRPLLLRACLSALFVASAALASAQTSPPSTPSQDAALAPPAPGLVINLRQISRVTGPAAGRDPLAPSFGSEPAQPVPAGTAPTGEGASFGESDDHPRDEWIASGHVVKSSSETGVGGNLAEKHTLHGRDDDDEMAPLGRSWQARGAGPGTRPGLVTAIVGEFAFYRLFGANVFSIGAGPRVSRRVAPRAAVFGQVLVGGLHFPGQMDFLLQPGGGVEFHPHGKKYRLEGELDFPIDFFSGGHEVDKRFGFAIAFPLGHAK
jgi:hypothetical protein